jgi:phage N-6-adenine-methyltransferase
VNLFDTALQSEQDYVPAVVHSVEWSTPAHVFEPLDAEFGFTLDVCASVGNAKCARFFTRDQDGLAQSWAGEVVWMNPPYARGVIDRWMKKAYESAREGGATVVCLVPSSTSGRWWHDYAMRGEIRFVRGRIKFGGSAHTAMFPCSVVIFRPGVLRCE